MESSHPILLSGKAFILGALFIGLGIFAAGAVKAHSDTLATSYQRSLTMSGHASRVVSSDHMKWSLSLAMSQDLPANTGSSTTLAPIEQQLKQAVDQIVASLETAGVRAPTVSRQPFRGQNSYGSSSYNDDYGGDYYGTNSSGRQYGSQTVVIESDQVEAMNNAMESIVATLGTKGVNIDENRTEFFYTKQDDLRRELLQEAVKDAHEQAEKVANTHLGKLTRLEGGVYLNISPVHSSYSGNYYGSGSEDTSSIEKKVSLDISATYQLD